MTYLWRAKESLALPCKATISVACDLPIEIRWYFILYECAETSALVGDNIKLLKNTILDKNTRINCI